MTAGRDLTEDEFGEALRSFRRHAFRLELQPADAEPSETGLLAAFLRDEPLPPTTHPGFRQWYRPLPQPLISWEVPTRLRLLKQSQQR